jgi:hypothetical protein
MEPYRSIYDFSVFVEVDKPLPNEVKTFDFKELGGVLSSMPHLQPDNSKPKIIGDPFGRSTNWKVYNLMHEVSSTLEDQLMNPSSELARSEVQRSPLDPQSSMPF